MIWCGWGIKENCHVLVNQFHGNIHFKTSNYRKNKSISRYLKWCFNASRGLKGLMSGAYWDKAMSLFMLPPCKIIDRGFVAKCIFPAHSQRLCIVESLRDREVVCSTSDRQSSNIKSYVWRAVSSHSSYHPQEVHLAQFSLYVHKGGLKLYAFIHSMSLKHNILTQSCFNARPQRWPKYQTSISLDDLCFSHSAVNLSDLTLLKSVFFWIIWNRFNWCLKVREVGPILVRLWPNMYDASLTINQHFVIFPFQIAGLTITTLKYVYNVPLDMKGSGRYTLSYPRRRYINHWDPSFFFNLTSS